MTPRLRAWVLGLAGGLVVGAGVFRYLQNNSVVLPATLLPIVEPNPRDLYQIVELQIAALRRNDYTTAYTFAATGIRQKFPREQFREMIRSSYPQLIGDTRVSFGETRFAASVKASALVFLESNGRSASMIYLFVKENGHWKIEGVQVIKTGSQEGLPLEPQT